MASTYADVSDVTARWARSASAEESTLIETRLADVERMIKRGFRKAGLSLDDQINNDELDVEDLKQVEADVVLRLARNPEGFYSETDGDYTYQFISDLASGKLEILPEEWETLGVIKTAMMIIAPTLVMPT